jgi:UrcA family protein
MKQKLPFTNFRRATMSAINLKNQVMRQSRVRALVLVGCVLGIGTSMVQAAPAAADVPSVAVQYSTWDLASDEGARNLYSRIASAARTVCPDSNSRDLNEYARSKSCRSEAIARAVHDVRSPRLAAVYSTRTNHG